MNSIDWTALARSEVYPRFLDWKRDIPVEVLKWTWEHLPDLWAKALELERHLEALASAPATDVTRLIAIELEKIWKHAYKLWEDQGCH
jgi:hypothetical protein